ncbi:MAG: CYTH domain-containing protein [Bacteroidales bacterium]
MGVEIERKFLVKGDAYRQALEKVRIVQGYLSTDPDRVVRVRTWGPKGFLTIKSRRQGISRSEYEFEIDPGTALEMIQELCFHPVIDKTRYIIDYKGYTWEVDEFYGENEGLVVAEIELPAEDTVFECPAWVGEEVTQDRRYYNSALVYRPFSKW